MCRRPLPNVVCIAGAQRLVADSIWEELPSILISASRGLPDEGILAFLQSLTAAFPELPVVGLTDWSPSGLAALARYRWGSRMEEGDIDGVLPAPELRWLALRSSMLLQAPAHFFEELSPEDEAAASSLGPLLDHLEPEWAEELAKMLDSGSKASLLAMYAECGAAGFCEVLAHQLTATGHA